MSHFPEDPDDLQGVFLPLDGGAGPARRISRQKAFELVKRALDAAHSVRSAHDEAAPRRARTRRSSH